MSRRLLAALAAAILACAGIGAAVAASIATTGTVSVCATATSPTHTVDVDGNPVATIPGDAASQCATTTYTVPTETVTSTVAGTTTTSPTTTTTTSSGSPTFASEIAYTQTQPAFAVKREVDVSTAAALKSAIANLQPGDLVKATTGFTVSSSSGDPIILNEKLSAPAEIDLTAGVKFRYTGTNDFPAFYIQNAKNVWLFGGDASSGQGGSCILAHGAVNILWWHVTGHDCGGGGIGLLIAKDGGPVTGNDIEGEFWHVGTNLAWDPHTEKGTGLHCAGEMADGDTSFPFTGNRLAFYCHDSNVGEAFAFGTSPTSPDLGFGAPGEKNTLILKAANQSCVATSQTCGNAITLWGHTSLMGLDIKYLEADNITGYGIIDNAVSSGYNLDGVTVDYARATNAMTDPYPKGHKMWGDPKGQTYGDVAPAP